MRNLRYLLVIPLVALVCGLAVAASSSPPNIADALAIQEALALERPDDPRVFNDLGNLLLLQRETERAEEAYRKALSLDPSMASAHFNLGLLQQQKGHRDRALSSFRSAIKHAPDHAWAHYQTGSVLESKGKSRRAVEAYAKAFRLNPDLSFADVNAHVIDSELTERALLVAFGTSRNDPTAPKVYQQPERIVALMVPAAMGITEEAPAMDEDAATMAESTEPATPAGSQELSPMPRSLPQVDEESKKDDSDEKGRVIRARDLDNRSGLNQAVPGGGKSGSTRYRPGTSQRTWVRPVNPTRGSEIPEGNEPPVRFIDQSGRPSPSGQVDPNNGRNQEGQRGNGGQVRYRPGVNSTGSLQIDLMPAADIPEVAPAG